MTTDEGVVRFATIFIRRRLKGFKKDINICLTADQNGDHAYMPGLMTCFSLLDLLSGLYAGQVQGHNHRHLIEFLKRFKPNRYDDYDLTVLYVAFRHKLAHLSHPYFVLNTKSEKLLKERKMLLTWEISSDASESPIRIERYPKPQSIRTQPVPWRMSYDHRFYISVRTLADDALASATAYVAALKDDSKIRGNFRVCMESFYQR